MTLRCHRSLPTTCAGSCPVYERPLVCDTTVPLYLGRIGRTWTRLLRKGFASLPNYTEMV